MNLHGPNEESYDIEPVDVAVCVILALRFGPETAVLRVVLMTHNYRICSDDGQFTDPVGNQHCSVKPQSCCLLALTEEELVVEGKADS